jgi:hypothetical protein
MLVDAALEVLGLSGEPSEAEVRRAYLQRVKEHPPERDPEGFRRVREAYERLKGSARAAPQELPSPELSAERTPPVSDPVEPASAQAATAAVAQTALSPFEALRAVMELAANGRFKGARELLEVFEQQMMAQLEPRAGAELGVRWKLAREVLATSELDSHLARAVARALLDGRLSGAAAAAESAFREHGVVLEPHMREHAPSLWSQLAPFTRPAPPDEESTPSGGRSVGGWHIWIVLVVLFNLLRGLGDCGHSGSSRSDVAEPVVARPAPAARPPARPSSRDSGAVADPNALFEPPTRHIMAWGVLRQALSIGDCQTVREQWRPYVAIATAAQSTEQVEAAHKQQILEMCPELQQLLEEPP